MKTITFFTTLDELVELTGLNPDQLWKKGFDLDDWDFGFVCDREWSEHGWWDSTAPYYEHWLLGHLDNYCCGYQHTEYDGKHYYIAYHS